MPVPHPQPPREAQDLARVLGRLAEYWAEGLTVWRIGARLGLTSGTIVGLIARARKHGDDRFRPRPTAPKPKVRRLKPVG